MRTIAILPVKSFSNAKQRLSVGVEPELRSRLAEAMLHDVLTALEAVAIEEVMVVTAGAAPAAIARLRGARVITDHEAGHNAAAILGIREAMRTGAERVLLVPGDCPALSSAEVDELLARPTSERSVIVVPDRHGTGTNALLIRPPDALAPAFGPDSCSRHASLAHAAGVACEVVDLPSLGLDIDTPEDLAVLGELPDRGLRTLDLLSRC